MKGFCGLILALVFVVSCGAKKAVTAHSSTKSKTTMNVRNLESKFKGSNSTKTNTILTEAEKYLGTPYRFGGSTKDGFDCSGLVCKAFAESKTQLPRRSEDQSKIGKEIAIEFVKPGDLLFFATGGGRSVSHVGIVNNIENDGEIKFIHASTSKGVIISSLNEAYWNKAFLFARSVL